MSDVLQKTIKPFMEMMATQKMMVMIPRMMENMGEDDYMSNGKQRSYGSDEDMPGWARELKSSTERILQRQEQEEEDRRVDRKVEETLRRMGISGDENMPRRRSHRDDEDEEPPKYIQKIIDDNKSMREYIEKDQQEKAEYQKRMQYQDEVMGAVSDTLNERLGPLERRLSSLTPTKENKGEIESIRSTIGLIKEIQGLTPGNSGTPDKEKEGFSTADADGVRKVISGSLQDAIGMYKDLKERDDDNDYYTNAPPYRGEGGHNVSPPQKPENPLPPDVQQYIDDGHEETIDNESVWIDAWGHKVPLTGESKAFASRDRMDMEGRGNPDLIRAIRESSVKLHNEEMEKERQAYSGQQNPAPASPEPGDDGETGEDTEPQDDDSQAIQAADDATEEELESNHKPFSPDSEE